MAVKFDYDLNQDFAEVKHLFLQETLSAEDIEDGLEPEEIDLKVAITDHAERRMNGTIGRDCEWNLVEELILDKSDILFNVKNGEEFILVNDKRTIALVCEMYQHNGMVILVLITVIRNVYMDKNYQECEKKVSFNKKDRAVY